MSTIDFDERRQNTARAAFMKWNSLQDEQEAAQEESSRLNFRADKLQYDIEAIENQWRAAWRKLGLY